jgi:acetyl-CoA carboxylase biotin carboxyl carrier protein
MTDPKRLDEVEALIAEFGASGMRELHVRCDEFEIYLSTDPDAKGLDSSQVAVTEIARAPAPASKAPASARPQVERRIDEAPDGVIVVRAPYMGTFYRAPKPGAPVYVEVGSQVTTDTELCLVEVMKLFTGVRAPVAGRIHAVLAVDGQMVEADQPLFELIPD